MAPRPKNPPPDRRREILDAALRVFSTKGYEASTNAEIAREAGVTAAALYYYFPSKAELFKAAITERKTTLVGNVEQIAGPLLDMPPDVVFPVALQAIGAFAADERTQAIMRMILSEGPRNSEVMEVYQRDVIGQVAPLALRYVQRQMDLGHLRTMDPRLLSLLVNGPLMMLVITRDFLKLDVAQDLTNDMVIAGIAQTILPAVIGEKKE
ncbi:MAG TPA: TetR/AcrR family transcriptional regulator [Symbiobacteriaceae bacterium]|nr:TetR/AcrR family transcriptional regulator [Symbiobacteriaceae bacterium]